ncbi:DsbA family protein [Pseudorhodobacter turbinis]|uniref:DsbA family protein n=1 Tax=Pseudorhodobacter turbinis TaxID=2500533 RepID=A0A4P8EG35_9RHOB|nr:DsbA family protein [Pseudorhodobacter turbinis]QCO55672.1 DsbA family protein [Pseudorhodobacter turbinis]
MNRREFSIALAALLATTAAPSWAQTADADLPEVPDMVLGNPDAKVVLTEYASYTCPHCATFHATVFKELKRDYIDTGKIKFVFREVYFDRYGLWAAMVARCGGEMRYFGIQDILFNTVHEWAASDDPATVVENLRRLGRTAGLEDAALDACMNDGAMAQAMVNKYQADTEADDINSTPSLVLNGTKHGNMNYADLKALLDAELAK